MKGTRLKYGDALRSGFAYAMSRYPEVFVIGQGLWAPWYVGNSMRALDSEFGKSRVIDTPVSEAACTGLALGASLHGYRPVVVHPRIDFMIFAIDQIVNQAAKWRHMFGGQKSPSVTIRGIINRGGEQGAQHSQALHSWFAHVPGLRVVMPSTVADAQNLLISSILCDDPVVFIDDRWLYERESDVVPPQELDLAKEGPRILREGKDVSLVAASYSTLLCEQAALILADKGIEAEIIDLRVINPLKREIIIESVKKTGRLIAVDGGWSTCGLASEVLASVYEALEPSSLSAPAQRITLPDAPAPTSSSLESIYYPEVESIVSTAVRLVSKSK